MNTLLTDRLFSDPRLRDLADRLRCPFRALGLLAHVWHGTQNMGVVYAEEAQLLNSLPSGVRRDRRYIDALLASGWLEAHAVETPNEPGKSAVLYRVIGNSEHVKVRSGLVENGKKGADKRWGKKDGHPIDPSDGKSDGLLTSPHLTSPLPPHLDLKNKEGEGDLRAPPPPVTTMAEARALSVSTVVAEQLWRQCYAEPLAAKTPPIALGLMAPPAHLDKIKLIAGRLGSVELTGRVLRAFVSTDGVKGFWKAKHWGLWLLDDDRDLHAAMALAGGAEDEKQESALEYMQRMERDYAAKEAAQRKGST